MTRHELAKQVAAAAGLTGERARAPSTQRLTRIAGQLAAGRDVAIPGLASSASASAPREGRNPRRQGTPTSLPMTPDVPTAVQVSQTTDAHAAGRRLLGTLERVSRAVRAINVSGARSNRRSSRFVAVLVEDQAAALAARDDVLLALQV